MENNSLNTDKRIIIAGPCSAENEVQVVETARQLKETGLVTIYRAGIWKPRTHPNGFEGVGSKGLEWLRIVKKEVGMRVSTEVGNAHHVYEALKYGIDFLWIGARTTANPFAVQEIADALKGVDIPVYVKNPMCPDLDLWIGAIERLQNTGIKEIGAIHRGFTTWEKSNYRNSPFWQIPIELKRLMPKLPLICDPSHISGNRELIPDVAKRAMDLAFSGLMIEVHPNPASALSDSKQQLTPSDFFQLIKSITIKRETITDYHLHSKVDELRQEIDVIDDYLLDLLAKRMNIASKIGSFKKEKNISILQSARWNQILEKMKLKAKQKGLSIGFIENIYNQIHEESINLQIQSPVKNVAI